MFYIYISLIGILDLIGMISAKLFSNGKNIYYLLVTILCFAIAGGLLGFSLQYKGLAITNIIWIVVSIVLVTIVDVRYFKESISLLQLFGVMLAMVGVVLVNIHK